MEKALIITPFFKPNIGGAETFAEDLAKALAKKTDVHICTIKWKKPILWQGMNFSKALILIFKLLPNVRKMTKKYQYDKVFALGLIPAFICSILKIKFSVIILALYDFRKEHFLYKTILNNADKVFVEGERGKIDMLKCGVKEEKIIKFQHWCDQGRFYYTMRNNKNMRVLFVGRPIRIKGKHIIQECEKLTKGIDYEYIENIPYSDLPKHYQMADVVVVPSLYSEGFSRVVIEAASCGCVMIVSNKGASPELVKGFGFIVEPTPKDFKAVLEELRNQPKLLYSKQASTAWKAKVNFSENNANCFFC